MDGEDSTCVMYSSCWKSIGSLEIVSFPTMLKVLDGHIFRPQGIIPMVLVELGGKIMSIEVEVVDTSLDYNLLLGHI